jgi:hypothetical protein
MMGVIRWVLHWWSSAVTHYTSVGSDDRTFMVEADTRAFTPPADGRSFTVAADTRIFEVEL